MQLALPSGFRSRRNDRPAENLSRIVDPNVFFILLIVAALGIYTEFTHPGLFAPGVIGGIAFVLALFSMHLLPVNLAGLLLIALAMGLFIGSQVPNRMVCSALAE